MLQLENSKVVRAEDDEQRPQLHRSLGQQGFCSAISVGAPCPSYVYALFYDLQAMF
jgi:hypothetical protein